MPIPGLGPRPSAFYVERQSTTRSPATPTLPTFATPATLRTSSEAAGQIDPGQGATTAGDGLRLAGLFAVSVSVWPNTGQTLSGAGNLLCWVFNPYYGQWARCPDLDISLSSASGFPGYVAGSLKNVSRLGMLINWVTSGVTVSGGSDVLVRLDGFSSVLGQSA